MTLYHLFALLLHGRMDEARRLMEKTNLLEQNDMHPLIQGIRFVFTNAATHGEFVDFLLRYVEFLLSEMSTAIVKEPNIADKLQSEAFYYLEFSTPLTAVAASARVQNLLKLYAIFKRFAIPMRMDKLLMVVEARSKNAAFGKMSIEQKEKISHLLSELRAEAEQQKSKGTLKAMGTTIAGDKRAWNTVG